ncbi:MAG: L,D-transpeptidase family protein [Rhodospirillales bacterium]|nr:L,D-transpeptidase family protein [Rhodospirillales bacterium]
MFKFFIFIVVLTIPVGAFAGYDKPYVGDMISYDAKYEDTFIHLARDYGLGFTELRAANPYVDPWLPGSGTDLILPTRHLLPDAPHEGIIINLADMRLYAFINGDEAPYHTPIGIGREGLSTPEGTTKIVRKVDGPVWRPTPRMRRENPELKEAYFQGPDNPMGTHALYLGWPQYALHGTNKPFGIGRRVSSGCIRLYPEKISELFELIPVGMKVTVVNQPIKVAWIDDELFLEANPSLAQSVAMEEYGEVPEEKISNDEMRQIVKTAGEWQDRLRWPAIRKALKERNGYPVAIARRPSLEVKGDAVIEHEGPETVQIPEESQDLIEGYEPPPEKRDEIQEARKPKSSLDQDEEQKIKVADDQSSETYQDKPFRTLNP